MHISLKSLYLVFYVSFKFVLPFMFFYYIFFIVVSTRPNTRVFALTLIVSKQRILS